MLFITFYLILAGCMFCEVWICNVCTFCICFSYMLMTTKLQSIDPERLYLEDGTGYGGYELPWKGKIE